CCPGSSVQPVRPLNSAPGYSTDRLRLKLPEAHRPVSPAKAQTLFHHSRKPGRRRRCLMLRCCLYPQSRDLESGTELLAKASPKPTEWFPLSVISARRKNRSLT